MQASTVDLYHKSYGHGEPIILLHGLLGNSDNWLTFAKRLAENFMVFLVDIRNHGRSPHTEEFSYHLAAEDVVRMMEKEWIHHAHVIGHSMGGKVAMQLAQEHPGLIDKLIVLDIGPGAYQGGHEQILEALSSLDLEQLEGRKEAQDYLMERIGDLPIVLFLMKNLSRDKNGGFRWKVNLPVLHRNYPEIIGSLKLDHVDIPTLFIGGTSSGYLNPTQEDLIRQHFTEAQVVMISGAGHWIHVDQPDALYEAVYDFLK